MTNQNATPAPQTKAVAKPSLLSFLESDKFKSEVVSALPKHIGRDRFVRITRTAIRKNPKLLECDEESFFLALLNLAAIGLEPDGRRAYLIPRKNSKKGIVECQFQLDYKGKVELAMRSGNISNIHADVVCDKDEFEFDTGEVKRHRIDFRQERGAVYAVYCIVTFKDGSKKSDCMSVYDVEQVRKRSQLPGEGPWVTDWDEMAKKTVFHRLSKWIELSPEQRDVIEKEDDADDRFAAAKPVFDAIPAALPEPTRPENAEMFAQKEGEKVGVEK